MGAARGGATSSSSVSIRTPPPPPPPPPSDRLFHTNQVNPFISSARTQALENVETEKGDHRRNWMLKMDFPIVMVLIHTFG
jgi:hypothetical protein